MPLWIFLNLERFSAFRSKRDYFYISVWIITQLTYNYRPIASPIKTHQVTISHHHRHPFVVAWRSQVFEDELRKKNKPIFLPLPERHSIFISQEGKLADEFDLDDHYLGSMKGGQPISPLLENSSEYEIHKALFIRQFERAEMDVFDDLNLTDAIISYDSIIQQMENDKGKKMPKLTKKQMMNIYNEIESKTAKDFDYATSHQLDKFNLDLDSISGGNKHTIAINK